MVRQGNGGIAVRTLNALSRATALAALTLTFAGCDTSIWDASRWGEAETVSAILKQDPQAANRYNRRGKTPLHEAAGNGKEDTTALLIKAGADLKAPDKTGMTPLHITAMWDKPKQAEQLLDAGADINARDNFGDTPLHTAAVYGKVKVLRTLVERGADIHATNKTGETPLQSAKAFRRDEAANTLQELGATH
ncbi:MAG: ankyrin repeat domain-containing protein [FCB group bacterium]|nr:ankyrin repeat domain-containing protein [FCB group bacterium]